VVYALHNVNKQHKVMNMKAVIYTRVSTAEQGKSGLGLQAQMDAITGFCKAEDIEVVGHYEEVLSGGGADALERRPQLAKALKQAKKEGAYVVVSRLDRLSRNVAFISSLMELKTPFLVVQLGKNTDSFTMHLYAVLSEKERTLISERTKAALKVLKDKGVQLGNRTNLGEALQVSNEVNRRMADDFANTILPTIQGFRTAGDSLESIAEKLNKMHLPTRRGGAWHSTTVRNILKRA
jgi:DNA invertase Pin-like site-specific DNA recombinase